MERPLFITGIGTDVGKTLISAILAEALQANYWKPVQAGYEQGTDAKWVSQMLSNNLSVVHEEVYKLKTPASPHIAARIDSIEIDGELIKENGDSLLQALNGRPLIIEGAGGLLVPLSKGLMVADLIKMLNAKVILVSRNYLGSINHSLLTASYCRANGLDVAGWIFNDDYLQYESEIVSWSGYPSLGAVPKLETIDRSIIKEQANRLRPLLLEKLQEA